jgi:23S rRNA pseudouridine2605 synthase
MNGQPLTFNMDIQPTDDVRVDGRTVQARDELVYVALNKPVGMISDRGIPNEKSALDLVKVPQRLFAVGRLDKDATGLLLLTNDGELSYRLTHPRFEHEKEYRVLVDGRPDEAALQRWREGVLLNGEWTAPAHVTVEPPQPNTGGDTWLRVILHEGRKRQIKRVAKLLGHPVKQLIRMRIGNVQLGTLRPGEWRYLTPEEVAALEGKSDSKAVG